MALLNRKLKQFSPEEIPLIETGDKIVLEIDEDEEDAEEDKVFKHHGVALWFWDMLLLLVEHLQIYGLILALALRWDWPYPWIESTYFSFVFNLDVWNIIRISTGSYFKTRGTENSFSSFGLSYMNYLIGWGSVVFFMFFTVVGILIYLAYKRPLYLLLYRARLKRVFAVIAQIIVLPIGITAARLFHCREFTDPTGNVKVVLDADTEMECWTLPHALFVGMFSFICLVLFILYPIYLIRKIRSQVCSTRQSKHEAYVQLKEAEFMLGLDILWSVGQFPLFSSFRLKAAYMIPSMFFVKFLLVFSYACEYTEWTFPFTDFHFYPSGFLALTLFVACTAISILRPFRVFSFNIVKSLSLFVNLLNAFVGTSIMISKRRSLGIRNSLLSPQYLENELLLINGIVVLVFGFWIFYLLLRWKRLLWKGKPLWPTLTHYSGSENTRRYLKAVLRARQVLERALSVPPIFAPVHDLEHQIQIINAYSREAEELDDPTFDSLWDLLDEMIDAYNVLSAQSLFAESQKKTIRYTAKEFLKLMPSFRRRLDQREYDLMLVTPVRRQILLKMFVLGMFVNGRAEKVQKDIKDKLNLERPRVSPSLTPSLADLAETDDQLTTLESESLSRPGTMESMASRPGTTDSSRTDTVSRLINDVEMLTDENMTQSRGNRPSSRQSRSSSSVSEAEEARESAGSDSSGFIPGQAIYNDEVPLFPVKSRRRSQQSLVTDTEGSTVSTAIQSTDEQGLPSQDEKSSDDKTEENSEHSFIADDARISEAESASLGSTGSIRDDKTLLV